MSTAAELRGLSDGEILDQLEEAKEELFNLRFQLAIGQLENTSRMKVLRRDIARRKSILRERQLAAQILQEESNG